MFHRPSHLATRCALGLLVLVLLLAPAASLAAPLQTGNAVKSSDTATLDNAAPATSDVYVVKNGDTLASIARQNSTTIASLMASNHLRSANFAHVGQRLVVARGTRSASGANSDPAAVDAAKKTGKWIDINLSQQRLRAYQGSKVVLSILISSGIAGHRTAAGRFAVRTKVRAQTMSGPGYWLPNVQWVMYFMGANAIHGTYWHHNFGRPMSHGCINATNGNAKWLYSWAPIGTPVVVHY